MVDIRISHADAPADESGHLTERQYMVVSLKQYAPKLVEEMLERVEDPFFDEIKFVGEEFSASYTGQTLYGKDGFWIVVQIDVPAPRNPQPTREASSQVHDIALRWLRSKWEQDEIPQIATDVEWHDPY